MVEIGTAIAVFSALKDLGAGLVSERDRQKAATIQIEFTNQLIEAQAQLTQLLGTVISQQGQIGALEKHVRDMGAAKAEKERYLLTKLGTEREFYAYRLRPSAELLERADEVDHFICQPCFEVGKKVVLSGNGDGYWECPVCKNGAQVVAHVKMLRFSGGRWGGLSPRTSSPAPQQSGGTYHGDLW